MTFYDELNRSKKEQYSYRKVYNNFKDKTCSGGGTGPSGPGGGSWWWLECENKIKITDGVDIS